MCHILQSVFMRRWCSVFPFAIVKQEMYKATAIDCQMGGSFYEE